MPKRCPDLQVAPESSMAEAAHPRRLFYGERAETK